MGSDESQSWRAVRGGRPLNERRTETYQRLMDAESRLEKLRRRRRLRDTAMAEALDSIEGG